MNAAQLRAAADSWTSQWTWGRQSAMLAASAQPTVDLLSLLGLKADTRFTVTRPVQS